MPVTASSFFTVFTARQVKTVQRLFAIFAVQLGEQTFTDTENGQLPDENGVFDVAQLTMWGSSFSL